MGWSPPRIVGYIRASTTEQGITPDVQRSAIAELADRLGGELHGVFEDTVSGSAPLEKRPGLTAALVKLRELGPGTVLAVLRRDRLARGWQLSGWMSYEVQRLRCRVVCCDSPDDGQPDPLAEARAGIDATFGGLELARIRMRTKEALAELRKQGVAMGAAPYGLRYRAARDAAGHRQLEPHPQEQARLALMRKLRRQGMTLKAIADQFNEDGVSTRKPGAQWSDVLVHKLLAKKRPPATSKKPSPQGARP